MAVSKILKAVPTTEGAGVSLKRAVGNGEILDPFLLLDDFSSDEPKDYSAGFPWHPHRGMETITYIIEGTVEHEDSIGNKGVIGTGNVQCMTAGSGIIHQEMPKLSERLIGFQLWVNLPKKDKMMQPRYNDIRKIPEFSEKDVKVKVISGDYKNIQGAVKNIVVKPYYFDVELSPGGEFSFDFDKEDNSMAYFFEGNSVIEGKTVSKGEVVIFKGEFHAKANERSRFLIISGKPINEPVAWYGPIVMNTQKEIETALEELDNDTFIKNKKQ